MGLNTSVIHVWNIEQKAVARSLASAVAGDPWAFDRTEAAQVRLQESEEGVLEYLVSPAAGRWVTILEGHRFNVDAPSAAAIATLLGDRLRTFALALSVVHSDVLILSLSENGKPITDYNSCPTYFEPVSKRVIEQQRPRPHAFAPVLPERVALGDLAELLQRGWWAAYDGGRLDSDGLPPDGEPAFTFEDDRMKALGSLLELDGPRGDYPYVDGFDRLDGSGFVKVRFNRARGSTRQLI